MSMFKEAKEAFYQPMYSVFDSKMARFANPFIADNDASVIRSFADAVNDPDPKNGWNKHPEDYSLFFIGSFDPVKGELVPNLPRSLITASACLNLKK